MLADQFSQTTALINTIIWPVVIVVALLLYRRELGAFMTGLGGRISRVSFGGASVEFVPASEAPASLTSAVTEFIDATSAVAAIGSDAGPSLQLAIHSTGADFVKIDLRSGKAWLTSRLYIFSAIFSETAKVKKIVFVQRSDAGQETFVGLADPLSITVALGHRFRWFCYALAEAERQALGGQSSDPVGLIRPFADLQWASRVAEQYLLHPLIRDAAYAGASRQAASEFRYFDDQPAAYPPIRPLPYYPAVDLLDFSPVALPIISMILPASGPPVGGTEVQITGEGFSGVKEVRFGNSLAVISNVSDREITAVSPPGNGSVTIRVLTPAGSSATTDDWVTIRSSDGSVYNEHAVWIRDGQHLLSLLGDAIDTRCITETTQTKRGDLREQVLLERGDFVVIVGPDKQFRKIIDRRASIERLVKDGVEASLSAAAPAVQHQSLAATGLGRLEQVAACGLVVLLGQGDVLAGGQ